MIWKINFIYRKYIIYGFFSLLKKNYILQKMALMSDAHMESFSRVFYHSRQYIVWNSSDFYTNGLLEIFKSSKTIFKNVSFKYPHKKKWQGLKLGKWGGHAMSSRKVIRWPWNIFCEIVREWRVLWAKPEGLHFQA